jgi:hypothetical protein
LLIRFFFQSSKTIENNVRSFWTAECGKKIDAYNVIYYLSLFNLCKEKFLQAAEDGNTIEVEKQLSKKVNVNAKDEVSEDNNNV